MEGGPAGKSVAKDFPDYEKAKYDVDTVAPPISVMVKGRRKPLNHVQNNRADCHVSRVKRKIRVSTPRTLRQQAPHKTHLKADA